MMWTDPSTWRRPHPTEYREWTDNLRTRDVPLAAVWRGDGSLRPSDLYCYLKARFGEPNGVQTFLAEPHSDNLFHWDYLISFEQGFIEFLSGNVGTEARVWANKVVPSSQWAVLIGNLKKEFAARGQEMGRVRNTLEKWDLFVNPFKRLEYAIHTAAEELEDLELNEPPSFPIGYENKDDYEAAIQKLQTYTATLNRASSLGLLLRYLCPVWAEAFVNLTIFVCGGPSLRKSGEYASLVREHIDTRVARIHEICAGFVRPVNDGSEAYKGFLRLMNYRNHLLHGNVDPTRSTFDTVFFDRHRPVFVEEDNLALRIPRKASESASPRVALADVEVVEAFIAHVWDCMKPGTLRSLVAVMGEGYPGWRRDTGAVGILFPERIVFSVGYGSGQHGGDGELKPKHLT